MSNVVPPAAPVQLTNQQFLRAVFGLRWGDAHVCRFGGDPAQGRWFGVRASSRTAFLERADLNQYFTVSLFSEEARQDVFFAGLYVLVVDDVGAGQKVDPALVLGRMGAPSWRLETSPGNEQWGYMLDLPELDYGRAHALLKAVVAQGLSSDSKGVARYVRLPVGTNGKAAHGPAGFRLVLREWEPARRWTTDELAGMWGVTLPPAGQGPAAAPRVPAAADEESADPVFRLMQEMGHVKGRTSSGWGYAVTCPNVAQHTGGEDSGCAYRPGPRGHWVCNHGHCEGLTWGDFFHALDVQADPPTRRREFDTIGPDEAARMGGGPAERFLAEWVFLQPDDAFLSLSSRMLSSRRAVDLAHRQALLPQLEYDVPAGRGKTKTAVMPVDRWFIEQPGARIADAQTYWPGGAAFFTEDGVRLVNRYRPPEWRRRDLPVSKAEVAPWLDLVRHVLGCEGPCFVVAFLDWCAAVIGAPGLKPGWMVCVQGGHGIGKDLMMRPVTDAVGRENVARIKGDELAGAFTGFAEKRLVVVSELKQTTSGSASGHDQYNRLKWLVDTTARTLPINPKYGRQYDARNTSAVFTSTNEAGAVALEPDDRRVLVCMSAAGKWSPRRYADLVAWLDGAGADLVAQWLDERWERMGRNRRELIRGNAPASRGKTEMMRAVENPVLAWVREGIEGGGADWPDLMTAEDVLGNIRRAKLAHGSGLSDTARVPSVDGVGRLLAGLGCERVAGGGQVVLPGGRRGRVWALRGVSRFTHLGGGAVSKLMASNKGNDFVGSEIIAGDFPGPETVEAM